MTRLASLCTLALAALAGLTSPAAADLPAPGANGTIIFASGRDDGSTVLSNSLSQLWTISSPGGTATRRTPNSTQHHRHPAWSPDHTKFAYAEVAGAQAFAGPYDIWVRDVTQPISLVNPRNITQSVLSEDRPAWSPDGTRIVYQQGNAAPPMSTNVNIKVRPADGTGSETTVAENVGGGAGNTDGGSFYPRPHWSPDSQTIFYADEANTNNRDIRMAPADGSDTDGTGVITEASDDYQPYVSPDGTKLCFTRQAGDKDVFISPVTGALPAALLPDNSLDEYECAWSPDQTKVLFVRGAQDAGLVMMRNSDGTGPTPTVADVGMRFDGNPDWAMNPSPTCQNVPASVDFNSFVSISLSCADVPEPFQSQPEEVALEIATPPSNGTLGGLDDNGRVLYTPNVNFQGTDTFTYTGDDQTSKSAPATVTVTVRGGPGVDVTASDISDVSVFPRVWRRGSGLPSFSARKGTRIQWRLSEAARVTLTFQRARPGRRVRGRCVRPTRANRARRRCTRFVSVRPSLTRANAQAGLNTLRFQGRLSSRRRLPLGTYRVVVGGVDAAGNRSAPERSRSFRIVAR